MPEHRVTIRVGSPRITFPGLLCIFRSVAVVISSDRSSYNYSVLLDMVDTATFLDFEHFCQYLYSVERWFHLSFLSFFFIHDIDEIYYIYEIHDVYEIPDIYETHDIYEIHVVYDIHDIHDIHDIYHIYIIYLGFVSSEHISGVSPVIFKYCSGYQLWSEIGQC